MKDTMIETPRVSGILVIVIGTETETAMKIAAEGKVKSFSRKRFVSSVIQTTKS
jgi:hypothetical protein